MNSRRLTAIISILDKETIDVLFLVDREQKQRLNDGTIVRCRPSVCLSVLLESVNRSELNDSADAVSAAVPFTSNRIQNNDIVSHRRVESGQRRRCAIKPEHDSLAGCPFLPLDEAVAYRSVFVIVFVSDGGWAGGRGETFLEPTKQLEKGRRETIMCQWGANRNPWAGHRMGPSPTPTSP